MNAEDYKKAGFRISLQISQQEIERAETDVIAAYIEKVARRYDSRRPEMVAAVMQLAFILLLQRHAVATRAGGKTKTTPNQSENAEPSQTDIDNADRLLRKIQNVDGNISELVDDILEIYYRNKYFAL